MHCLAPNCSGDGTGCDNMTCIIVSFKQGAEQAKSADSKQELKRSLEEDENAENSNEASEEVAKKLKTSEPTESSN